MEGLIENGLPVVSLTMGWISLVCSMTVLMVWTTLRRSHPTLINRVSIRLQVGITISDGLRQLLTLITQPEFNPKLTPILNFLNNTLMNVYCILNIAIAVNIFLLFILGKRPSFRWEISYWKFCVVATILLNTPSLIVNSLGDDKETQSIFQILYPNGSQAHVHLIQFLGAIFAFFIVILSLIKILMNDGPLFNPVTSSPLPNEYHQILREYMKKSILFPLAFSLCSIGPALHSIYPNSPSIFLTLVSILGLRITGLLTLLAFLFDPSVAQGLHQLYQAHPLNLPPALSQRSQFYLVTLLNFMRKLETTAPLHQPEEP